MELVYNLIFIIVILVICFAFENYIIPFPRKYIVYYQINNTGDQDDIAIGVSTNSKRDKKRFYNAKIYYKDESVKLYEFNSYDKFHGEFTVFDNVCQMYKIKIYKRGKFKNNIGWIELSLTPHIKQELSEFVEIGSFHKLEDF